MKEEVRLRFTVHGVFFMVDIVVYSVKRFDEKHVEEPILLV